jgi:glutaredoxin 3
MSSFVDNAIKNHKVTVFSKTYCPYCTKAKKTLGKYDIKDLVVIELDDREDADKIQDYLASITGARTVPRVFVGGNCIGGGDDTAKMDKDNKLKGLLEKVGALD